MKSILASASSNNKGMLRMQEQYGFCWPNFLLLNARLHYHMPFTLLPSKFIHFKQGKITFTKPLLFNVETSMRDFLERNAIFIEL